MARSWISDYLQVYPFWLADIGPFSATSLPILTPLFGFSAITSPELNLETDTFREGNGTFDRKVVKGGSMSAMTLSRGVTFYDMDFANWIKAAQEGNTADFTYIPNLTLGGPTYRRNLMLVHFFTRTLFGRSTPANNFANDALSEVERSALFGLGAGAVGGLEAGLASANAGLVAGLVNAAAGSPFEFAARVPARAWILYGCVPSRYKAGSDFDASSGDVSIAEIEVQIEFMEQFGVGLS